MKKFIAGLYIALGLILWPAVAFASHSWVIRMSDPTTSTQLRTFNVGYTALSVESADEITVKLFENGTQKDTQTTPAGGDSGTFVVTVPNDGSFTYHLEAKSSLEETTKSTAAKVVTVSTAPGSTSSVITVTDSSAGLGGQGGLAAGGGAVGGQSTDGGADTGQVDDQAATNQQTPSVQGTSESVAQKAKNNLEVIVLIALGLIAAYYWFFYRVGKPLFPNRKD